MKTTGRLLVAWVIGCLAVSAARGEEDSKAEAQRKALEAFAGTWEIVAVQPEGSAKEARRLVFRKDGTYAALDGEGKELWAGTFNLDPAAAPKIWDHRSNEAAQKGGDALGIYELSGDDLKVCCVVGAWKDGKWSGKPRPTEIALSKADVVLELRRVKPGK
ncbi:MAG: TIGR03067 domain-containing protein [Planctomycetota bacterium]|nr:TIGR03067 domain-containing protein [Planctomycetota bacterium]